MPIPGLEPLNSHPPGLELYELECGHEPFSAGPLVLPGTGLGNPHGVKHTPRSAVARPAPLFPAGSLGLLRKLQAKAAACGGRRQGQLWATARRTLPPRDLYPVR